MLATAKPPREPAVTIIGSGLMRLLEAAPRVLSGKPVGLPGRHAQLYSASARSREPGTARVLVYLFPCTLCNKEKSQTRVSLAQKVRRR